MIEQASLSRQTLASRSGELIRKAILSGGLPWGSRLSETELAQRLHVSRGPVREALRDLARTGIVRVVPHHGAFVASLSERDILDDFHIRERLEGLAARLACERASNDELNELDRQLRRALQRATESEAPPLDEADSFEFHRRILDLTGNETLTAAMKPLWERFMLWRSASLSTSRRVVPGIQEQLRVVDAMKARNPDLAEAMMVEHIRQARYSLTGLLPHEGEDAPDAQTCLELTGLQDRAESQDAQGPGSRGGVDTRRHG